MLKRFLTLTFIFTFAFQLMAFDVIGHKIVADIAYANLNPCARKKVNKLLGKRGIVAYASWADAIKSDSKYAYSYGWHFQNLDESMSKQELEHLIANPKLDGEFLFFALDSLTNLKNLKKNEDAVKFIVHIVGDMFQPLHMGRLVDRGGNDIQVMWFGKKIRLHQLWDNQILQGERYSYSEYSEYLQNKYRKQRKEIKNKNLSDLIWTSFQLSNRIYAYDYNNINPYDYIYEFTDAIDLQLYTAGIQLAKILNKNL